MRCLRHVPAVGVPSSLLIDIYCLYTQQHTEVLWYKKYRYITKLTFCSVTMGAHRQCTFDARQTRGWMDTPLRVFVKEYPCLWFALVHHSLVSTTHHSTPVVYCYIS